MTHCLYINSKGIAHYKHSFSAGNDYDQSPLKYYLRRVIGWREKDDKASFKFGRAIEKAVEFYHDNLGRGGIEKFEGLWSSSKDEKLIFTKLEKDWATLNHMGIDMMRLYMIRQPSLPIPLGGGSVFQREYAKSIFPGDPNYGEILDAGKFDIVTYVEPSHPMLPQIHWLPEYGLLRPVIIDMKTSGIDYSEQPGMAAYDKQLRRYSWQSGIRDVAFLAFIKKNLSYNWKKSRVTIFRDVGDYKAGTEMFVASPVNKEGAWLVGGIFAMEEMDKAQGKKDDGKLDTTKAAIERKNTWLSDNAIFVKETDFTRQRLQFNAGFVTKDSAKDAGSIAGRQIVQIVNSWKNNSWPNTFGIRYPQDDSRDPYFRAFVLKDETFKNEYFKIASAEELNDLFDEDIEPEGSEEE